MIAFFSPLLKKASQAGISTGIDRLISTDPRVRLH
jgi:hypothetical protein